MAYELVVHPDGWRTVSPKPTPEELSAFYANEYFQKSHGPYDQSYSETELAHRDLIARVLLQAIEAARGGAAQGARLLEVGCGEGWFLAAAKAAGYAVQGLDFSEDALRRFHPELIEVVRFGDAFEGLDRLIEEGVAVDVCVIEHVLEHVLDPEALLGRLRRIVRPGGVVAISVPNDFNPVQTALRASGRLTRDVWVVPPEHISYFNTDNLPRLIERCGFEVKLAYSGFPIDWFLMHPGSDYVANPAAGKPAHAARMAIDMMLAERGVGAYLNFARALFACGAGRNQTVIAAPRGG
jgi:2-polyprenyl-3-methyl-5-hydroxy-6-metoxy-1,4-benzoquinol methylase